jgi:hypothetical protein
MLSSLKSSLIGFPDMTARKVSIALFGIVLVFEGRVFALKIFTTGQQSLQAFLVAGVDRPKLPNSGRRYYFDHQVEVCDPSNYILASNALSSSRLWLSIFGFGQQSHKFT